jgi:hypothetical protein
MSIMSAMARTLASPHARWERTVPQSAAGRGGVRRAA